MKRARRSGLARVASVIGVLVEADGAAGCEGALPVLVEACAAVSVEAAAVATAFASVAALAAE